MGGQCCRVLGTVMGPACVPTPSWAAFPSQPELDLSLTAESLEGRPLGDIRQGYVPVKEVLTGPRWPKWAAVFEQALGLGHGGGGWEQTGPSPSPHHHHEAGCQPPGYPPTLSPPHLIQEGSCSGVKTGLPRSQPGSSQTPGWETLLPTALGSSWQRDQ